MIDDDNDMMKIDDGMDKFLFDDDKFLNFYEVN